MAARKPLVIGTNGLPEQLQAADTLDASTGGKDIINLTNANAGNLVLGEPVYISASGSMDKAQANAAATAKVIGFVADATVATGAVGACQTDGVLSGLTGLTPGASYFLDATTAGAMTTTAPITAGQFNVHLGTAISATELEISIKNPVRL